MVHMLELLQQLEQDIRELVLQLQLLPGRVALEVEQQERLLVQVQQLLLVLVQQPLLVLERQQ